MKPTKTELLERIEGVNTIEELRPINADFKANFEFFNEKARERIFRAMIRKEKEFKALSKKKPKWPLILIMIVVAGFFLVDFKVWIQILLGVGLFTLVVSFIAGLINHYKK